MREMVHTLYGYPRALESGLRGDAYWYGLHDLHTFLMELYILFTIQQNFHLRDSRQTAAMICRLNHSFLSNALTLNATSKTHQYNNDNHSPLHPPCHRLSLLLPPSPRLEVGSVPSMLSVLFALPFLGLDEEPNISCNVALKLLTLPPGPPGLPRLPSSRPLGSPKSISPLAIECLFLGGALGFRPVLFLRRLKLGLRMLGVGRWSTPLRKVSATMAEREEDRGLVMGPGRRPATEWRFKRRWEVGSSWPSGGGRR